MVGVSLRRGLLVPAPQAEAEGNNNEEGPRSQQVCCLCASCQALEIPSTQAKTPIGKMLITARKNIMLDPLAH